MVFVIVHRVVAVHGGDLALRQPRGHLVMETLAPLLPFIDPNADMKVCEEII
jgi:hypothetical protein